MAGVVGDVLLALGNDAGLGIGYVVAVHTTGPHELNGGLLTSNGHRIGGLDITLDGATSGAVRVRVRGGREGLYVSDEM